MDLAKQAQIIGNIHDTLSQYVGQKLRVRANMGRSKIVESEGVLMQVQMFLLAWSSSVRMASLCSAASLKKKLPKSL